MPIDVLAKITHGYYQLTTAEKKVADYVLLHTWETQYMSISELAEACDVAEATVSRFCRRLRFSGYSGFKLALANTPQSSTPRLTGDIAPDDSVEELLEKLRTAHIDALDQTMRLLAPGALGQAVDLLTAADRVLCMGQGGSMILAMEASHLFANISSKFQCVQDSHRQAMAAAEGCIALFLLLRLHKGYSGYHVHCPPARMQVHSNHPFSQITRRGVRRCGPPVRRHGGTAPDGQRGGPDRPAVHCGRLVSGVLPPGPGGSGAQPGGGGGGPGVQAYLRSS